METFGVNSNLHASIAANVGRIQSYVPPWMKNGGWIHDLTNFNFGYFPYFLQYRIGYLLEGDG